MNRIFFKKHQTLLFVLTLTLGVLFYTFWWGIENLLHAWESKEYGHSYFLPLLALMLALHRLSAFPMTPKSSWGGVVFVSIGLFLLLLGELSAFRQMAHWGLYICLVGVCLGYLGWRITFYLAPAWGLLLFAIPLPVQFQNILSLELKLISSSLGAFFLTLLNIPVFQDGNIIDLGTYKLQVVDACSGLRYLFPLMSFGFLVSYLLKDKFWKRVVVFLSTIPITIILNAFRIMLVGIAVNQWGPKMAEGVVHEFEGWLVFSLCLLLLLGLVALILKTGKNNAFDTDFFMLPKPPFLTQAPLVGRVGGGILLCCLIGAFFIGTGYIKDRPQNIPQINPLSDFTDHFGNWKGTPKSLGAGILKELDLTDYWIADYKSENIALPVNLYIAYYAMQKMGSSIHSPATCVPGGGWEIESIKEISLVLPVVVVVGGEIKLQTVTRMIIRKGLERQVIYYWFNQRGKNVSSRLIAKKDLLINSVFYNRSDASLIRLITPIGASETQEEAEDRLKMFLEESFSSIVSFLPAETLE